MECRGRKTEFFTRRRGGRGGDEPIFNWRGTLRRDQFDDCLGSDLKMASRFDGSNDKTTVVLTRCAFPGHDKACPSKLEKFFSASPREIFCHLDRDRIPRCAFLLCVRMSGAVTRCAFPGHDKACPFIVQSSSLRDLRVSA